MTETATAPAATAPSDRPNVLVIMADEHAHWALGVASGGLVQTPNLDALAATGTRYTGCWTPSPICVPARGSFATGRWVHEIGNWDSAQAYTGRPGGWTHAVRSLGGDVVSFGKLHHRSAADDDGFTDRVAPMFIAGGIGWVQGLLRKEPLPYVQAAELAADVGTGETTYTRYDRRVATAACEWITGRGADPDPEPWTAFVSFVAPHYPLSAPDDFTDMYALADVPPPRIAPQEITHPAVAAMADYLAYGRSFDDDLVQHARRAYLALCSFVDDHIGQLLAALDATGQRENTTVIFTSDHGELLGNRGLWCKSFMYEDSVAVPLIASGPGFASGRVVDTNVNLVDIAPTICELTGAKHDSSGTSLLTESAPDRPAFSEYHDGGSITGSFAVLHGEWKYVHHEGFAPELFNLTDDPDELNDLGTSPDCAKERSDCADVLYSIVDPKAADAAAFASQQALIDHHGGREAIASAFQFNHTPAPE